VLSLDESKRIAREYAKKTGIREELALDFAERWYRHFDRICNDIQSKKNNMNAILNYIASEFAGILAHIELLEKHKKVLVEQIVAITDALQKMQRR